jgi:hypothetical protein
MVTLLHKGVQKIIKTFFIEVFFPFAAGVNYTGGATLGENFSANF